MENSRLEDFFEREQININQICNNIDCRVYLIGNVNPIAAEFGMYSKLQDKIVSVGDIIGFEDDFRTIFEYRGENIFDEMKYLFKESENDYQNRCLSMLDYTSDNIIEGLKHSFHEAPIQVKSTGEGSYSVGGNGKHRYTILRTLYLAELERIKGNMQEVEKLKSKYRIPVKVEELDLIKTYSKYLLMTYGANIIESVDFDLDQQGKRTGYTIVDKNDGIFSNERLILNDADLIKYTKKVVQMNQDATKKEYEGKEDNNSIVDKRKVEWLTRMDLLRKLPQFYKRIGSFKKFFDANFVDIYLSNDIDINRIEEL